MPLLPAALSLALLAAAPGAGPQPPARAAGEVSAPRKLRINGAAPTARQLETLALLERHIGRVLDGDYWYDTATGASGRFGGPTLLFLPPGLDLAGPLPANASGGGSGTLTGVFVNGRELHPVDVMGLRQLLGQVLPGRWWVDAQGNYGLVGGPALGNLLLVARARGGNGNQPWSKHYEGATPRQNMNLASDGTTTCVSTANYSRCTGE
jgi:hypothetical protein